MRKMKISSFTIILTFVILSIIGAAMTPLIEIDSEPTPRQGKTITINYTWPNVSAKVIEQKLTSPIEGMVSAIKGVESVYSNSYYGGNEIAVHLKEQANISATRFEISSILRQSYSKLPKGISYPTISGAEIVNTQNSRFEQILLLTYQINANMQIESMKDYLQLNVIQKLQSLEEVTNVELLGIPQKYIDVTYDPSMLSTYGITSENLTDGIRNYMGQDVIIGTITHQTEHGGKERISLLLTTENANENLEQIAIKNTNGNYIYINELASITTKETAPNSFYRINGENTIYLNVYTSTDREKIATSNHVQKELERIKAVHNPDFHFRLSYDNSQLQREEMSKLIWQTLLSLLILLLLVWTTSKRLKYLLIVGITITANLLIACIGLGVLHIKLHSYSLAAITISLGLIIDATIVMADHYVNQHNKKAFSSILASMLTTMGTMLFIFFLPEELQFNLYDFAWIVIINLCVSLSVAFFLVPALIDKVPNIKLTKSYHNRRWIIRWNQQYKNYIILTSKHKWIYYLLLIGLFGFPFNSLPNSIGEEVNDSTSIVSLPWYAQLYNSTFGSEFFILKCKTPLANYLGGVCQLFADYLEESENQANDNKGKSLHITGELPIGGTAVQLNQKMTIVENLLKKYPQIKEFTTHINGRRGGIDIIFKKEIAKSIIPYRIEKDIIGKLISIGGVDWATYGVSKRGFSNSLNLQHRSEKITLTGYNYNQLYRLAEDIEEYLLHNERIKDLVIQTPNYENQEEEFYMKYHKEKMAIYNVLPDEIHKAVQDNLMPIFVGLHKGLYRDTEVYLTPETYNTYDLWHLENEQIRTSKQQLFVPEMMEIKHREAKNIIPKEHQEYVLSIAFNVVGSYVYTKDLLDKVVTHFNKILPIGYHCKNGNSYKSTQEGAQYWLLLIAVLIVFFICTIHFESLRLSWVIISVIPVAIMGVFLSFLLTGIEFGSGGYASLVLLIGIVVNSSIYILSQYRQTYTNSHRGKIHNYICAYNHKIIPVFITTITTIMSMIPFFINGENDVFWLSFATGVTGGLLFSIPTLVFLMPIFINFQKH